MAGYATINKLYALTYHRVGILSTHETRRSSRDPRDLEAPLVADDDVMTSSICVAKRARASLMSSLVASSSPTNQKEANDAFLSCMPANR